MHSVDILIATAAFEYISPLTVFVGMKVEKFIESLKSRKLEYVCCTIATAIVQQTYSNLRVFIYMFYMSVVVAHAPTCILNDATTEDGKENLW